MDKATLPMLAELAAIRALLERQTAVLSWFCGLQASPFTAPAVEPACPRCGESRLIRATSLGEDFERWSCACGATGRSTSQGLEEVPLPVLPRRSELPQSKDSPVEGSAP